MSKFAGFPEGVLSFLKKLGKNNSKDWFEKHRDQYEAMWLEPATAFVEEMTPKLQKHSPEVDGEAKTDRSIRRLHRDIRFSPDKTPYKTHLDLWWWQGEYSKYGNSAYFFRLEKNRLYLGAGMHDLPKDCLARFRQSAAEPKTGEALLKAIAKVEKAGYEVGGKTYKRQPRGMEVEGPRGELLLHSAVYAYLQTPPPADLHSRKLLAWADGHYKKLAPIHHWMAQHAAKP